MKHFFIVAVGLLFYSVSTGAMEQSEELTAHEKSCYDWFVEQQKQLPGFYDKLCPEDRDIINKQVKYSDNPEGVTRCRYNYVDAFYCVAQAAEVELKHDKETLKSALLKITKSMHSNAIKKPTDELSARMHVFSSLLSKEEQATYTEDNYRKNPKAAEEVAHKWSSLVVNELVKLHKLEDAQGAKEQKAHQLYQDQLEKFKKHYSK